MATYAITNAGRAFMAAKQAAGQPAVIDRFMLANISGLNASVPVNLDEPTPDIEAQVKTLGITKDGYITPDEVVYSLYLPTTEGDYVYNWMGLLAEDDTLVAVAYLDAVTKIKTEGGTRGNALTENFLLAYTDAQTITNVTVEASSWQVDFEQATETLKGLVEIATQEETDAGEDDEKALTPKKAAARFYHPGNLPPHQRAIGRPFIHLGEEPPDDCIEAGGFLLSRVTYENLWNEINKPGNKFTIISDEEWLEGRIGVYSNGDGLTTFRVPMFWAEHIRGLDNGRGIDTGRVVGSSQLDSMQPITGAINRIAAAISDGMTSSGAFTEITNGNLSDFVSGTSQPIDNSFGFSFDSSLEVRTSDETRPRNIAVMFCIEY